MCCYMLAQAGSMVLFVWVFYQGLGFTLPRSRLAQPWPWVVDLGLVPLFGLQHSGMARQSFKALWTRLVPPHLERSIYVATSGVVVTATVVLWQSLGDTVLWRGPTWLVILPLLAAVGTFVLNNVYTDHRTFFGLRQAWNGTSGDANEKLIIHGPYRYVRHPLMLCLLLLLWGQPVLSLDLAVFNAGLTLYIGAGVLLEERDLARRFHPAYGAYRRLVPAPIPCACHWRRRDDGRVASSCQGRLLRRRGDAHSSEPVRR